jgi:HlyD family secretion protein
MSTKTETAGRSIRRHVLMVCAVGLLVVGGAGGWVTMAELSGAVVASGSLVVDSNVKKVQHPTGGVVGELRVRDGAHVHAGDVVIRLDETVTRANLAIVVKGIDELLARQARLEAERDEKDDVHFASELTSRSQNADVWRVVDGEQRLFELRRQARTGQKAQLKERIGQLKEEIKGVTEQAEAKNASRYASRASAAN